MTRLIRAAGGLVFRTTPGGAVRVLVAHRPKYDDWSLPKGKESGGETPEQTALREVLEETGYLCRIVAPLGSTRHRIDGDVKEVTWFAMRPLPASPGFVKNQEIDEIRWLGPKSAQAALDYQNDRNLVAVADLERLSRTGILFLLRHSPAFERADWQGEDRLRPLTEEGRRQAHQLGEVLAGREVERILSSPSERCVQTVEPLAEMIGAEIETTDALAESSDPDTAHRLVESLVGQNVVLCSHGDVIPEIMKRLMWAGLPVPPDLRCAKGSIWEVEVEGGRFTSAHYLAPPEI